MIFKRTEKNYIVKIIANNYYEELIVKAKSKKEIKNLITCILLNCSLFPFKDKRDFKLKINKRRQ